MLVDVLKQRNHVSEHKNEKEIRNLPRGNRAEVRSEKKRIARREMVASPRQGEKKKKDQRS